MTHNEFSISINETMLIIFPLLITQPRNKTKSICVTGSCLGQGKRGQVSLSSSLRNQPLPFVQERKKKASDQSDFQTKPLVW